MESKDPRSASTLEEGIREFSPGMFMLDIPAYLSRIGYAGSTQPTAETLRAIHRAHLLTVPFENLDIGLSRKIECDADAAVRKIVEKQRGGFCYEMNGAFAALLRELGFQVTLLSARVAREDGGEGPEFDHLTLRVDLQEPWLADVGFGESFMEPLRLQPGQVQKESRRSFRILEDGERLRVEMPEPEGTLEAGILLHAHTPAARGLRRDVSLSPDFSRIALHAQENLHQGNRRWPRHDC